MKKIFTLFLLLASFTSFSQSLVISQVYGAGGNSGSVYKNDFVELFNPTAVAINVNNWSVQYNSAASTTTTWQKTKLPNVTIQPGQYFLIQMAAGTGGTTDLPAPDLIGTIAMSGTAGKVVLVSDTNAIAIACPTTNVVDKVGYGTTSTCFEGGGPTPAFGSNTNAVLRANGGCTDSNNNTNDFAAAAAAPRNTGSPVRNCGGAPAPALSVNPSSLANFGSVVIGNSSTGATFSLSGSNLTGAPGNITITAPAHFQVSLDNSTWSSSVSVPFASATLAATTINVRFTPSAAGAQSGTVTASGGGVATAVSVAVSGTGLAAAVPTLAASGLTAFGNTCLNTVSIANSFIVSGTNLTAAAITVGPLAGYSFSTSAAGTYATTLTLAQPGGAYSQQVFVQFTPVAVQSYNGNIPVAGGGVAAAINVAAAGAGINAAPSATTGTATAITSFGATIPGVITANGCSAVTAYGVEYSTVNGFVNGTVVPAANNNAGNFSVTIAGLLPGTTYYYKVYATNAGGNSYGFQASFTTLACAVPTLATSAATGLTTNAVTLTGAVADTGCSAVNGYGFEYSSISNFPRGYVTRIAFTGTAAQFATTVSGLINNTKYYYRVFAVNQGGVGRSNVDSFVTIPIATALTVYNNPVERGKSMHFSLGNLYRGYYGLNIFNAAGQLILHKDMGTQVGFIDATISIPASLEKGIYILKVDSNQGFTTQKKILVH